jgi:hypothetical protein
MIFQPGIIALLMGSALISLMLLYSAYFDFLILRKWDIKSGSELQLILERRTYLVSTLMTYAFAFQLVSFFLFILTAENLHSLFVGAMCAAGTLNVNAYGYPAVLLKIINFLFAGVWLIINHADNRAYDYPLLKTKYLLLMFLASTIITETIVQAEYFLRLKPDIITSCCGSLFSAGGSSVSSVIASLPVTPMRIAFYMSIALTIISGVIYYLRDKGGYLFSFLCGLTFVVSFASLISFISVYFYELPTHHCPFCILQREYGFIGYPLYGSLFGGGISGIGVGVLMPFRKIKSLSETLPSIQRRLALISVVLFFIFAAIAAYPMIFSGFVLEG